MGSSRSEGASATVIPLTSSRGLRKESPVTMLPSQKQSDIARSAQGAKRHDIEQTEPWFSLGQEAKIRQELLFPSIS
jgi:hypothetical protein